ncbi:MAG TPA: DUF2946 family protein [Burkholderiaceae bacterium]|jgi:hypothetical protein
MMLRKPTSRWALWVFAAALLLKSAMPLLASVSAQMQGKTLVEVCTVYGMALVPLDGDSQKPAPAHDTAHTDEHCALTALGALASAAPPVLAVASAALLDVVEPPAPPGSQALDACAAWVARLKHGPPAFA